MEQDVAQPVPVLLVKREVQAQLLAQLLDRRLTEWMAPYDRRHRPSRHHGRQQKDEERHKEGQRHK